MKKLLTGTWMMGCTMIVVSSSFAAAGERAASWRPETLMMAAVSTAVFSMIGIVMAIIGFKLFDAVTPFKLEAEIAEKQNVAVAILCGAMVLGICLIVAAAVL